MVKKLSKLSGRHGSKPTNGLMIDTLGKGFSAAVKYGTTSLDGRR